MTGMSTSEDRTCRYCGQRFDTPKEREGHVPCPTTLSDRVIEEKHLRVQYGGPKKGDSK